MTADDLYFKWDDTEGTGDLKNAVAIGDELIMSQFAIDGYSVNEITASYVTGTCNKYHCHHNIIIIYIFCRDNSRQIKIFRN